LKDAVHIYVDPKMIFAMNTNSIETAHLDNYTMQSLGIGYKQLILLKDRESWIVPYTEVKGRPHTPKNLSLTTPPSFDANKREISMTAA
jgi:hypothetical protein